jgi:ankyrin repeat protein
VDARNSAGAAPLHEAALSGNVAIGELLISRGAKIDAVDEASGASALYYAVSFGRSDFAKLLITQGAAVNMKTKTGNTPLSAAKDMRLPDVEAFLRKSGALE